MEDGRVCERRANVAPPTQHLLSTHEEEEWLVIRPLAPAAELLVASILVDEISDRKISEMGAENWRSHWRLPVLVVVGGGLTNWILSNSSLVLLHYR
jgi:hypothetical protein